MSGPGATTSSEMEAGFEPDEELYDCGLAKLYSDQTLIAVVRGDVANFSLNLKSSLIARNREHESRKRVQLSIQQQTHASRAPVDCLCGGAEVASILVNSADGYRHLDLKSRLSAWNGVELNH